MHPGMALAWRVGAVILSGGEPGLSPPKHRLASSQCHPAAELTHAMGS